MKSIALCLIVLISFSKAAAVDPDPSDILKELKSLEARFGGHLGVMARNLRTGEEISYNSDERFPTASVIKLPIMIAFFDQVQQGKISGREKITFTEEEKKPGSGILQYLNAGDMITLLDAVRLMILLSDNTATNLVIDHLGNSHDEQMDAVNKTMVGLGLKNTRLLNRLYSWQTKKTTPESIRYGIGVSTPADMNTLLEMIYRRTLVDSAASEKMLEILKAQFYSDMIPRYLPSWECKYLSVAHKTGSVNETKVDVGLVLSDKADIALSIFVDKHPDHEETSENAASVLGAFVARAVWNHWTGSVGYAEHEIKASHVDWNFFPGGKWGIWRSTNALFPHPARANGFTGGDGTFYPATPHYVDSSIAVFVPDGFKETADGVNLIVHFHGHMNDNMGVLEQFQMPQSMIGAKTNAILVLTQGPYRARDSFGGKMEDDGGLKRLVDDVLETMKREEVTASTKLARLILSAHSGGYRPTAFALDRGGLNQFITHVFLFDAFYANQDMFKKWLEDGKGTLMAAYTTHLREEHTTFEQLMRRKVGERLSFTYTTVSHDAVVHEFFGPWLAALDPEWKIR